MNKRREEDAVELGLEELKAELCDVANLKLPDPNLTRRWQMQKDRRLWIDDFIDDDVLEYERQILLWNMEDVGLTAEERKPIWIYLFNYGGNFELEWSLIDVMDASVTPVYTVNLGLCASAAADIFTAGRRRFMLKNARIMYHQGFVSTQGDAQKVNNQLADYNRQLKKTEEFLLERTKIPSGLYEEHKYDDWYLSAADCMQYGVCDLIVSSLDEVI